ncbi:sugar ABC transporter substrate-binding protein [Falsibacillus pallidus]|uniref:Maltodextrin-binding protein n=1 Tax=Falsibacillus pallidus TaxID=493781 RepID=A0A370GYU3_9BACI|nr:extracellular solute-binding protein [Falsibacillus pallidus]RDI47804.1 carbohydrate ABC transporter substrate-binding protein (CUT1 family) [Falsibacillus pallidus]
MKKALSLLMALILVMGVLAACGPKRETGESKPEDTKKKTEEAAKPDKLVVWVNNEDKQKQALQDIFAKYTEKTGIKVEAVPMDMLDQVKTLALDGPAGKGPDLFFQPHDRIGSIVLQGLADPVDLGDAKGDYIDTAVDAVTYDGKVWGAPLVVETYGTFYNKDLVDKAPETMDELMEIAKNQTDASKDKYGFLMEAANFYFSYPFFAANGGYVFKKDNGSYDVNDIGLNNDGAKKGGELIGSWFKNGYIPVEVNPDIMNGLFTKGNTAVVITGPWNIPTYKDALGDKLGTATLPKIDGKIPQSFVGVKSWMLSSYSKNKEWATDLMKFVTNQENSLHYFEVAGEMPANKAALEDDKVTSDQLIAAFAEQVKYGEPMPSAPEMQQVWEPINNALAFIAKGQPVGDVLDEAVKAIKDNIAASK